MGSSIILRFNPINKKLREFLDYLKSSNSNTKENEDTNDITLEELNEFEVWCKKTVKKSLENKI